MKRLISLILVNVLCIALSLNTWSNTTKIDSLKKELQNNIEKDNYNNYYELALLYKRNTDSCYHYLNQIDTNKVNNHKLLGDIYLLKGSLSETNCDYVKAINYEKKALHYYTNDSLIHDMGRCLMLMGLSYNKLGKHYRAIEVLNQALKLLTDAKKDIHKAVVFNTLANVYADIGITHKAVDNYLQAIKIFEKENHLYGVSALYNNIALLYKKYKNYKLAIEYFKKAEQIALDINKINVLISVKQNQGTVYTKLKLYDKALSCFTEGLEYAKKQKDSINIASLLVEKGVMYKNMKKYNLALNVYNKALSIYKTHYESEGILILYINISTLYLELNELDIAEKYSNLAYEEAKTSESLTKQKHIIENLALIYKRQNKHNLSSNFFEKALELSDSINKVETVNLEKSLSQKIEYEKKEQEVELLIKNKELQDVILKDKEKELKIRKMITHGISFILFMILILVFIVLRSKKKISVINKELKENNEKILLQNEEIISQKEELESNQNYLAEANNKLENANELLLIRDKQITDSINYALGIQKAILPSFKLIKDTFPNSMIFYMPKDVVSGDFYQLYKTHEYTYFIVADCTGHGVPGAFMSLISSVVLSDILKSIKIKSVSHLLEELNKKLKEILQQNNPDKAIDDGLDITVAQIANNTDEIQVASANHIFYVCMNNELKRYVGDIYSIGGGLLSLPKGNNFEIHHFNKNDNPTFIFSSDGFYDQFGDKTSKKFGLSRFEEMLRKTTNKSFEEKFKIVEKTFFHWKGNKSQIDDVLLVCFSINNESK